MKAGRKIVKGLAVTAAIFGILVMLIFIWASPYIRQINALKSDAKACVAQITDSTFVQSNPGIVYDCDGNELFRYSGEKNMRYVSVRDIPQPLIDAFVVMEDRRFYSHQGVDYVAVVRAFMANVEADGIVQGASTITQQLARNIFLTQEISYSRKLEEIFIADALEKKYSKDQIMEYYLNNIYFGNGFYGVGAAALGYYGKDVSKLSVGECILLASIPNNPSQYELFEHENEAVGRARIIAYKLYEEGRISEEEYMVYAEGYGDVFADSELIESMRDKNSEISTTAQGYVYTYVTHCAAEYLMTDGGFVFRYDFSDESDRQAYDEQYNYWYKQCVQRLYRDGYKIYTSINQNDQQKLQEIVDEKLQIYDLEDGTYLQGAAVCIDNKTGYVNAIVGGRTQQTDVYGFNRAYQSYRQPGSSIKPLNVYTPYLEQGHYPEDMVSDTYAGSGPKNAGGTYYGDISLTDAVRTSSNIVAWNAYGEITPAYGISFLTRMGFSKVYMDKNVQAGALGGFTYGVSPEELAGGFYALENSGIYRKTTCIRLMMSKTGQVIKSYQPERIYSKEAADNMTYMLETVVSSGTGKAAALENIACAGKTGTTNDNKDVWFAGYTPYYTMAVWCGYDTPKEVNLKNGNTSCLIWHDFMQYMHEGIEAADEAVFERGPLREETEEETETAEDSSGDLPYDENIEYNPQDIYDGEYEQELTLPEEESIEMPYEEGLTAPEDEILTLPYEERMTAPYEEKLTAPQEERLTLPYEER